MAVIEGGLQPGQNLREPPLREARLQAAKLLVLDGRGEKREGKGQKKRQGREKRKEGEKSVPRKER